LDDRLSPVPLTKKRKKTKANRTQEEVDLYTDKAMKELEAMKELPGAQLGDTASDGAPGGPAQDWMVQDAVVPAMWHGEWDTRGMSAGEVKLTVIAEGSQTRSHEITVRLEDAGCLDPWYPDETEADVELGADADNDADADTDAIRVRLIAHWDYGGANNAYFDDLVLRPQTPVDIELMEGGNPVAVIAGRLFRRPFTVTC